MDELDPSGLDERDYIALSWVRELLRNPSGVPKDIDDAFQRAYTPGERLLVMAAMKGMFFVNVSVNTFQGMLKRLLESAS